MNFCGPVLICSFSGNERKTMFPDAKKSQMREFRIRGDARQCRFAGGAKLARTGK